MKNIYVSISLWVLLFVSVVVGFIFFDLWKQEQGKVKGLEKDLKGLELKIEALNGNNEQDILSIGEDFVKEAFTYSASDQSKPDVMDYYTDEYKDKLDQLKGDHVEEEAVIGSSSVNVLDKVYNKVSEDHAAVTVSFEQNTNLDGLKTKVLYDVVLDMVYKDHEWKINNMKLIEKV